MTTRRTSANIYDYPEHLNPFYEEDNHSRLRFWAVTKKSRSNSFSFQSIKDFRGSLRLPRSRNRTETSSSLSQLNCYGTKPKTETHSDSVERQNNFFSTLRKLSRSFSIRNKNKNSTNSLDKSSPIENDEVQLRVSPPKRFAENYSEPQPLPRSRFYERVRNSENLESPKSTKRNELRLSTPTDDNNPFNEDGDEENSVVLRSRSPPKQPATPSRKKNRAPPPPVRKSSLNVKTLMDSQTSIQNEDEPSASTDEKIASREIETINASNVDIEKEMKEVIVTDNKEDNNTVTTEDRETSKNEETVIKQNEDTISDIVTVHKSKNREQTTDKVEKEAPTVEKISLEENASISAHREKALSLYDVANAEDCINYNSEITTTSSHSSITKLEQLQEHEIIEDTSDLLELVNKLKMEVDKMTDDTNNNIIETEEEKKARNIESWIKLNSSKEKNEILIDNIDDNDVVCSAPMSPRFVRLRKDNDWIKQDN